MIAIIDYDTGNLRSVANALQRLGADYVVTADHSAIRTADRVILPGVGEASSAMQKLHDRGLDALIPSLTQPVLGICIGMQLLCRNSEEGNAQCLGIFDTDVRRLVAPDGSNIKIPHMGWDDTHIVADTTNELQIQDDCYYFVHSYAADVCADTLAITNYCRPFSAILAHDNFIGVQFHPEKSGSAGSNLLNKFLQW